MNPTASIAGGRGKCLRRIGFGVCLCLLVRAAVAASDSDAPASPPPIPRWDVGAAFVYMQSPYLGQRDRIWGFPALSYRGPRFFILGPGAGVHMAQIGPARADLVAQVRFSPFNEKKGGALAGLKSRSTTVEAGPRVSVFLPYGFRADAAARADLLNRHSGWEAGVGLSRSFRYGAWRVTPSVRMQYWSTGLTRHYYGIRTKEQTTDRPAYAPGGDWTPSADLMILRQYGSAWSTVLGVGLTRLGSEVVRSPIVEDRTMTRLFGSVTYAF